eukprot:TRINITY_DN14595_c2_g2_i1.p1 TRINITY_DN14595_c2_g2~~TRINITY_DN14595_c2_g2_i1.p1  ORF type:complete len:912 (-),score=217.83 TRINITY_DN14595_c2_g2_i1:235-2970(-)
MTNNKPLLPPPPADAFPDKEELEQARLESQGFLDGDDVDGGGEDRSADGGDSDDNELTKSFNMMQMKSMYSNPDHSLDDAQAPDTEESEAEEEPKVCTTRGRRFAYCAEPIFKGYFKEPNWNKHYHWERQLIESLGRSVIFKSMARDRLHKMMRAASTFLVPLKDDIISEEGDKLEGLMVVLQGQVECHKDGQLVKTHKAGDLLDEEGIIWRIARRGRLVAGEDNTILGRLCRQDFTNLVVRDRYYAFNHNRSYVNEATLTQMLPMEKSAMLTDVLVARWYKPGECIIRSGDMGTEMYFVDEGEARIWRGIGGNEVELGRARTGSLIGELALLSNRRRAATITCITNLKVLTLSRKQFERLCGPMKTMQEIEFKNDPRKLINDFYLSGDSRGPRGVLKRQHTRADPRHGKTEWFAVYRPTSRDAIAKMLNGDGVGKGLNVKGKSAKEGCLSGFVPFIQVSDNKHKPMIEQSPPAARCKIYYKNKAAAVEARWKLDAIMETAKTLKIDRREIIELNSYAPKVYGLDIPEPLVREAYIIRQDLSEVFGWQTGRRSEPFSMDMNLHASRGETGKIPEVVCYQWDPMDVMNPRGLLVAYAEEEVQPVVSDFDTFTVASKGMKYDPIPLDQALLILWSLEQTEAILNSPDVKSWTTRWIEVLRTETARGFHPTLPLYGFGDPTSYKMIGDVVDATKKCGAVRHGAECFNFFFPQELDEEFLVVWNNFEDKPWKYFNEASLRNFLLARIKDGFAFPINPVWAVRDKGWYDVFAAMMSSDEGKRVYSSWYLPSLRIQERVNCIHNKYPHGFFLSDGCPGVGATPTCKMMELQFCASDSPFVGKDWRNNNSLLERGSDEVGAPKKTARNSLRENVAMSWKKLKRAISVVKAMGTTSTKTLTPKMTFFRSPWRSGTHDSE